MRIPSLLLSSSVLRIRTLLFSSTSSEQIIKNGNVNPCVNCVFYKPSTFRKFTSEFSKCEKFGEKDIITGVINYSYADSCRNNQGKCGIEGHYFVQESELKLKLKLLKSYLLRPPNIFWGIFFAFNIYIGYKLCLVM
jgi:hypothetical protein